ncbi:50S ribosomal protein L13 [Candidatus Collierbacteria bacterium RIFCSPLOWO2_01_FULL_50_23]|uniref:Large ribosomal subunit protein uL13 n=2 Tax=Candidatus Collieribacteriota TaxID=1752725 RepID=A0A1F5EXD9_9BACT|nr:MAG: 50S ribosomal protein L13 [Candidatus Collierbacteria bacterium RIFCSPHIGHO2_02_FULL_49_10]OGD72173.1 MAG: 50S ribosomal protein L13 [Candidatus Collierbacteria bacterium RIFCSPHIGHO2_01_FULL_50_25]OGD74961.1 MAG: 50S ribosomal protein L13 [Candidatus Collierbacteria bacterium RIFCSPLOWO2_01_FULL_50_23]
MNMTTALKAKEIKRGWHFVDLSGRTLGRVSTEIALYLMGKNKATFSPAVDDGDFVVAINAKNIVVTGKKLADKKYQRHSGFPGGFREETLGALMIRDPRKVIERSVKGMLPKNKLQDVRLARLKVFKDERHPYAAQLGLLKKETK